MYKNLETSIVKLYNKNLLNLPKLPKKKNRFNELLNFIENHELWIDLIYPTLLEIVTKAVY